MQPATPPSRAPRRPAAAAGRVLTLMVRGAQVALALLGAISWVVA